MDTGRLYHRIDCFVDIVNRVGFPARLFPHIALILPNIAQV